MSLFFSAAFASKLFPYPFVKCSQFMSKHPLFVLGAAFHSHL